MTSDNAPHRRVKVIKLIWSIPHYRVPVFRRLSQNPYLDFTVCAGDDTRTFDGAKVASASETGSIEGVNWRRLDSHRIRGPFLRGYEWQPEAVKIAWSEDFDVLIIFGPRSLSNWLVRIACRLRRIPFVEWTIGVKGPDHALKWAVRKFYNGWANAHLLYGTYAKDYYVQHGFSDHDVFVVRNSLDHDRQVAIREKLTAADLHRAREQLGVDGPEDRLIFHSGRLEKKKNLLILFDALKILKERGRHVKLVLIGKGREEDRLKRRVQDNGIEDSVVFYGACYDEAQLGRVISASDLCVVPGVCGLIAMHSMVYGTPILTRENTVWLHGPEVEVVVEGRTGGYFRDGNLEELVGKMESMLYPVPCKRLMSEACMRIIDESYTPEYQESVIIQCLNRVLGPGKQIPVPSRLSWEVGRLDRT